MLKELKPTELKLEIVRRGIRQVDLCAELGINWTRFNQIVNGRIDPDREERRAIAKQLGCSQASLFGPN